MTPAVQGLAALVQSIGVQEVQREVTAPEVPADRAAEAREAVLSALATVIANAAMPGSTFAAMALSAGISKAGDAILDLFQRHHDSQPKKAKKGKKNELR